MKKTIVNQLRRLKGLFFEKPFLKTFVAGAWGVALASMLGSLYFSEIWGLAPCKLCWWQRIFMYPLVFILPVAWQRKDKRVHAYVLPLSITGTVIALYHTATTYWQNSVYGVNETLLFACSGGVDCARIQVEWLGFITIPLLSLMAFLVIDGLMWLHWRMQK